MGHLLQLHGIHVQLRYVNSNTTIAELYIPRMVAMNCGLLVWSSWPWGSQRTLLASPSTSCSWDRHSSRRALRTGGRSWRTWGWSGSRLPASSTLKRAQTRHDINDTMLNVWGQARLAVCVGCGVATALLTLVSYMQDIAEVIGEGDARFDKRNVVIVCSTRVLQHDLVTCVSS